MLGWAPLSTSEPLEVCLPLIVLRGGLQSDGLAVSKLRQTNNLWLRADRHFVPQLENKEFCSIYAIGDRDSALQQFFKLKKIGYCAGWRT